MFYFMFWKPDSSLFRYFKTMILPGCNRIPLYRILYVFIKGIQKGYIGTRASAISFSFFIAIFPFLIFLFTVIPFIPVSNFQQILLNLIQEFIPDVTWTVVRGTITDIITRPRTGLLLFNLALTLYFSAKGVKSLIEAFNNTYHDIETRSTFKQYLISIALVVIFSLLLIISIFLMTFGSKILKLVLSGTFISNRFIIYLIMQIFRWIVVIGLILLAVASMYFLAPSRADRFGFFSPGAWMATLLIILTTQGFNFYVDNFSRYNALYGSICTLLVMLLWIYFNSLIILLGFELNSSIKMAENNND